jgi:hypothetical protein
MSPSPAAARRSSTSAATPPIAAIQEAVSHMGLGFFSAWTQFQSHIDPEPARYGHLASKQLGRYRRQ